MKLIPMDLIPNSNVLISGCGGGFDIAVGIPLALELEAAGHHVVFSSYSFSDLGSARNTTQFSEGAVIVDSDSIPLVNKLYFPEIYMSQWFRKEKQLKKPVYCYKGIGVETLVKIFNDIAVKENIDYHIIVDGGSDGILRGDEYGLGSPVIDAISIIAASETVIPIRYYMLSAFGTEGIGDNDVSHAQVLQRMSELIAENKMFGSTSILNNASVCHDFKNAMEYIFDSMAAINKSVILSSIVHSLNGDFGHTAVNSRTKRSPIWVSALTSVLWFFDCDAVARMKIYYDDIKDLSSFSESRLIIWDYWNNSGKPRSKPAIPV